MNLSVTTGLAELGLSLRLEEQGDTDFLARLFASTREAELLLTGWSVEQKTAFCAQQFRAQTAHYDRAYSAAVRKIVLANGSPAGRLYLFSDKTDLRIVDISLLPLHRNRGFGTALLYSIFEYADATRLTVSLNVATFNPARALYERLGFEQASDDGVYIQMQRLPA